MGFPNGDGRRQPPKANRYKNIHDMFNQDFYPTPPELITAMVGKNDINGISILEPSAGKGNLIDGLQARGARVFCCELHPDLAMIAQHKATFLKPNFFDLSAHEVSHIKAIYMNPPFSDAAGHILHAWNIAPDGCHIVALCNAQTLENRHTRQRRQLSHLIKDYGYAESLGSAFDQAERQTDVGVSLVNLYKPGDVEDFAEFFTSEDDAPETQGEGLLPYNEVRDCVQRYVNAIRLYEDVMQNAIKMNVLVGEFKAEPLTFVLKETIALRTREEFKIGLQKKAWTWVLAKMDMERFTTEALRGQLNKFVENQQKIPFTMKNIYKMIEMIWGTREDRMNRAMVAAFDTLTRHYADNRYHIEGWKTNSHYLINRKFIMPNVVQPSYSDYEVMQAQTMYGTNSGAVNDLSKALCFVTGENYDTIGPFDSFLRRTVAGAVDAYNSKYVKHEFATWYEWGFFEFKGYKKGTVHFKFKDEKVWMELNRRIAKIKGYPLPEHMQKEEPSFNF